MTCGRRRSVRPHRFPPRGPRGGDVSVCAAFRSRRHGAGGEARRGDYPGGLGSGDAERNFGFRRGSHVVPIVFSNRIPVDFIDTGQGRVRPRSDPQGYIPGRKISKGGENLNKYDGFFKT